MRQKLAIVVSIYLIFRLTDISFNYDIYSIALFNGALKFIIYVALSTMVWHYGIIDNINLMLKFVNKSNYYDFVKKFVLLSSLIEVIAIFVINIFFVAIHGLPINFFIFYIFDILLLYTCLVFNKICIYIINCKFNMTISIFLYFCFYLVVILGFKKEYLIYYDVAYNSIIFNDGILHMYLFNLTALMTSFFILKQVMSKKNYL